MDMDITEFVAEELLAELGSDMANFRSRLVLPMLFEFKADNTYVISFEERETRAAMTRWFDEFIDFIIEVIANSIDMSAREFLDAYRAEEGSDFKQDLLDEVDVDAIIDELLEESKDSGIYKVEGDRFFTANEGEAFSTDVYEVIEVATNTLRFVRTTDPNHDNQNDLIKYPFTLDRVR
jgi:hypothetical protein